MAFHLDTYILGLKVDSHSYEQDQNRYDHDHEVNALSIQIINRVFHL